MMRALLVFLIVLLSVPLVAPIQAQEAPEQEALQEGEQEEFEEEGQLIEEEEFQEEEEVEEQAETPPVQAFSSQRPISSNGLVFRFNNVPIATLIDTVMKELGYSYIIDPRVQGTASIHTMGEIPKENAFEILEQLLQMNGQGIVRQDGMYVIVPLGETTKIPHELIVNPEASQLQEEGAQPAAAQLQPAPQPVPPAPAAQEPVVSTIGPPQEPGPGETLDEGVLTYVIALHHIPSAEMVTLITPFVSNGANMINYASANILILTDYRQNVEQALKLIRLLDTEYFDLTTVDLVPIRYNQAVDIAEDLAQIFAPGAPAGVRLVTIERLNSILVVTRSVDVFQEVQELIDKLDTPSSGTNLRTFVYQVENNTATNIASILSQLYQDGVAVPSAMGGAAQEGQAQQPVAEPGFVPAGQQGLQGRFRGSELGPSLTGRPMASGSDIRSVVSGNIKIIVNEFNNSLIIQATESDYQFLLLTIRQLDVLPRQVLIEAKIYNVELQDNLSYGVSAFLEAGDPALGPSTTGSILDGTLSATTTAFIGSSRQLRAVITALSAKTNVQILEAPRILALDGVQAQINIGAEVPVTTASFGDPLQSGSSTNFVNSIQFRPTGVTLLIMPRISASGIVTMDLAIEVSSATGQALTPTINTNAITTSLIVRDGQTVALAGIISDSFNEGRNRVPILGSIPVLGGLFGTTTRDKRRNELVFFITPYVIRNLPTATELTLDFRRALRNAYEFIEKKEREEDELIEERRTLEQIQREQQNQ
jgi:general secretion pathway protein D